MDASTQYLIDIATKLSGSADASSALADLGQKMVDTGASAKALDAAVMQSRTALEGAAAASKAAADALSEGQSAYGASEAAADKAAKAAEKLGADLEKATAKVAAMRNAAAETGELGAGYLKAAAQVQELGARQAEAQAKAAALRGALGGEAAALDALAAAANAADAAHKQMASGLSVLEKGVKSAADAEKQAAKDAASAAEKASKEAEKAQVDAAKIAKGSGKVNELAEAFGALGGPVGGAGQKLFQLADGLGKMSGAAGASIGAIVGVTVVVVALAAAMIAGTVAIAAWGVGMADTARTARLSAEALEASDSAFAGLGKTIASTQRQTGLATDQLTGLAKQLRDARVSASDMPAALKAVALAESALGQGAAGKLIEDLKSGKKSASELAAEMQKKFGGIVAKQMLSLDAQALRLKGNLAETFGGLKIEGILGAIKELIASASGGESSFDWVDVGAVLFGALIGTIAGFITIAGLIAAPIVLAGGIIVGTLSAIMAGFDLVADGIRAAMNIDLSSAASDMIAGLVAGIVAGNSAVVGAMMDLAGAAVDAVKSALSIKSPSKVFAGLGGYTAEGFAEGVDDGAPMARTALESMVSPPDVTAPDGAAAAGSAGGGKGAPIHLEIHELNIGAGASRKDAEDFVDQLMFFLESKVLQSGGGALAPAT